MVFEFVGHIVVLIVTTWCGESSEQVAFRSVTESLGWRLLLIMCKLGFRAIVLMSGTFILFDLLCNL